MSKKITDLTGEKFNQLTVIRHEGCRNGLHMWLCKCECGNETISFGWKLKQGRKKSCGCSKSEATRTGLITHGKTNTPEYEIWRTMIRRCIDPRRKEYPGWGGRGIKVCERWLRSFEAFYEDMGQRPTPQHSIDRKNNDGNYEPDNCKWSTPTEQAANRRPYPKNRVDKKQAFR